MSPSRRQGGDDGLGEGHRELFNGQFARRCRFGGSRSTQRVENSQTDGHILRTKRLAGQSDHVLHLAGWLIGTEQHDVVPGGGGHPSGRSLPERMAWT